MADFAKILSQITGATVYGAVGACSPEIVNDVETGWFYREIAPHYPPGHCRYPFVQDLMGLPISQWRTVGTWRKWTSGIEEDLPFQNDPLLSHPTEPFIEGRSKTRGHVKLKCW